MQIVVSETPEALGRAAAMRAATLLNEAVERQGQARLLLAAARSQIPVLTVLRSQTVFTAWERVEMLHLDEYLGLGADHRASFRQFLTREFTTRVPLGRIHWVLDGRHDVAATIERLTRVLAVAPVDVGLIGIGENGHLAFNDPPADFRTRASWHRVQLATACRQQQVHEGWFPTLEMVPTEALSMTVPAILATHSLIVSVPYASKAEAVRRTLQAAEPDPSIPASALHLHPSVDLFLDRESSGRLD